MPVCVRKACETELASAGMDWYKSSFEMNGGVGQDPPCLHEQVNAMRFKASVVEILVGDVITELASDTVARVVLRT